MSSDDFAQAVGYAIAGVVLLFLFVAYYALYVWGTMVAWNFFFPIPSCQIDFQKAAALVFLSGLIHGRFYPTINIGKDK